MQQTYLTVPYLTVLSHVCRSRQTYDEDEDEDDEEETYSQPSALRVLKPPSETTPTPSPSPVDYHRWRRPASLSNSFPTSISQDNNFNQQKALNPNASLSTSSSTSPKGVLKSERSRGASKRNYNECNNDMNDNYVEGNSSSYDNHTHQDQRDTYDTRTRKRSKSVHWGEIQITHFEADNSNIDVVTDIEEEKNIGGDRDREQNHDNYINREFTLPNTSSQRNRGFEISQHAIHITSNDGNNNNHNHNNHNHNHHHIKRDYDDTNSNHDNTIDRQLMDAEKEEKARRIRARQLREQREEQLRFKMARSSEYAEATVS